MCAFVVLDLVFNARRYASAVHAVVVCPTVCLSQAGIVPKRQTTPYDSRWTLVFFGAKDLSKIPTGIPNSGVVVEFSHICGHKTK